MSVIVYYYEGGGGNRIKVVDGKEVAVPKEPLRSFVHNPSESDYREAERIQGLLNEGRVAKFNGHKVHSVEVHGTPKYRDDDRYDPAGQKRERKRALTVPSEPDTEPRGRAGVEGTQPEPVPPAERKRERKRALTPSTLDPNSVGQEHSQDAGS